MKIITYHDYHKDHWEAQSEFRKWCLENNIKAKWKSAGRCPKNAITYQLDNVPESQRKAIHSQTWLIENEEDALAAKLAWSE